MIPDTLRKFNRLIVVIFKDILDRLTCDDAFIAHFRCRALAENDLRGTEEGVLKKLLVKIFSLLYLFFKPTHLTLPLIR